MSGRTPYLFLPVMLLTFTWCEDVSAAVTPGAVIEVLATDNPSAPDSWSNLGSSGGEFIADISGDAPSLQQDEDLTAYYVMNGASWGNGPGTAPTVVAESFTIDIWLRRTSTPTSGENHLFMLRRNPDDQRTGVFLRHDNDDGDPEHKYVMWELLDSSTHTRSFIGTNRKSGLNIHDMHLPVPLDEWFHLGLVYDNEAHTASVYSNGVNVVSLSGLSQNFGSDPFSNNTLGLQNPPESLSRSFRGDINSFRVYDIALSEEQIAANFAMGPAKGVLVVHTALITDVSVGTDIRAISFNTTEGEHYFLQSAINPPDWMDTGASVIGTGGVQQMYDPAGFSTEKTYRVLEF